MKREKYLIQLSHDHHHGLTMARSLQELYSPSDRSSESVDGKKERLINFFNSDLKSHFGKEEKIFQLLKGLDEKLDELIYQTIEEHRLLEELILSAQISLNTESLLNDIGSLLKEHIRKEERILFPLIEEKSNDDIRQKILSILL